MEQRNVENTPQAEDATRQVEQQPFEKPKLTYIKPKLVKHGDARKITAGFFGTFSP